MFENTKLPDVMFVSTGAPSIDKPFSQPTISELNIDIEEFLLILKAFSNFSPTGSVTKPSALAPIIVKFENTAAVCGVLDDP